jgi:hypothetical protein
VTSRAPWTGLLAAAALALGARPAAAVAPCFHVCHLGQGQPLLLADVDQLWIRRCSTPKPGAQACVLERVDRDGRVLEQVPHARSYDEDAFEAAHLRGHEVVSFGHQSAWTDLKKRYELAPYRAPRSILRIDRGALVCAADDAAAGAIRRPLGCTPRGVHVFAGGTGRNGLPEDPTGTSVVVATCADGSGTREVVAICRPPRST